MGHLNDDAAMGAALALASRGRGRTFPNPNVGCLLLSADGRVVGRGWTQPGGRPHAEAMALAGAGAAAGGATAYVTLEPCAHESARGPACADSLIAAGVARVVGALTDPDPRTAGQGYARLRGAGIDVVEGVRAEDAALAIAGFLTRQRHGRPQVTLKLATSLDGRIARPDGSSRWITGAPARAHTHLERSRHEAILVGRGTWEMDAPRLDVRLAGLEDRSPIRVVLSSKPLAPRPPDPSMPSAVEARTGLEASLDFARDGRSGEGGLRDPAPVLTLSSPAEIATLPADHILVEGGAETAAAFLRADLVDRLLLYRAPILIGAGRAALGEIGLADLADAHGRWRRVDARMLGSDRVEDYARAR